GDETVVEITFDGTDVIGGSVADGRYDLTIFSDRVPDLAGRALYGDGDGISGGDFVSANAFFRLFGDGTGDGVVDNRDVALFRGTFNKKRTDPAYLPMFDYAADGVVAPDDRAEM